MADLLLLRELSGRQLLPAEQQRVGHLSERVQVDEPHPALIRGRHISLRLRSGRCHWGTHLAVSVDIENNCNRIKKQLKKLPGFQ